MSADARTREMIVATGASLFADLYPTLLELCDPRPPAYPGF